MTQINQLDSAIKTPPALLSAYKKLLDHVKTRQEAVQKLDGFLRRETSWLTSPASTRFHLAHDSGLLEHSVNVATTLLKLRTCLAPDLSDESCVIAGLFHDLGKIGMPGPELLLQGKIIFSFHISIPDDKGDGRAGSVPLKSPGENLNTVTFLPLRCKV